MKALLSLTMLLLTTFAFSNDQNPVSTLDFSGSEVIKMRVQSEKVPCGSGVMCFSVQKESSIGKDNWETLSESIEGFNYEAGFVYDITVKIERIATPGTDQYHFTYTLIEVISKQAD